MFYLILVTSKVWIEFHFLSTPSKVFNKFHFHFLFQPKLSMNSIFSQLILLLPSCQNWSVSFSFAVINNCDASIGTFSFSISTFTFSINTFTFSSCTFTFSIGTFTVSINTFTFTFYLSHRWPSWILLTIGWVLSELSTRSLKLLQPVEPVSWSITQVYFSSNLCQECFQISAEIFSDVSNSSVMSGQVDRRLGLGPAPTLTGYKSPFQCLEFFRKCFFGKYDKI